MHPQRFPFWLVLALAALALGCQPEIGDACTLPSDCSVNGDRLCDPTFPGGYCTRFNCEPGSCPDEAICVAYRGIDDELTGTCGETRFRRTFCMKSCKSNKECREDEGYRCLSVERVPAWSAVVVERGSVSSKVCAVPYTGEPPLATPPVCTAAPDASFPDVLVPDYPNLASDAGSDASSRDAAPRDASREGGGLTDVASPGEAGTVDGASRDAAPDARDAVPPVDARAAD